MNMCIYLRPFQYIPVPFILRHLIGPCYIENVYCGLCYHQKFHSTCYFKSTNGHTNKWSFNTFGLNLRGALLAGKQTIIRLFGSLINMCICLRSYELYI